MADAMRTLPDAELEVMQAIWACEEPVKRAAISAILDRTHPMAPTTLLTVLSGMKHKCGAHGTDYILRTQIAVEEKTASPCSCKQFTAQNNISV